MGFRAPQFESPVNALAQVMQLQHAQSANELQKYGLAKAQRQDSETNALSQLLSSPGFNLQNPSDQARAYGVAPTVATTYIKGMLDNNNTQAQTRERNSTAGYKDSESAQKRTNLVSQAYGYVKQNPTPEAANQVIDTLQLNGVLTAEQASQHKAAVTANPGQIAQMADMLFRGGVSSENQMMKTQNQNIGGATQTLGIDPITGKTQVLNSVNNTQSPDSAANNLTTMRGQNMTSNTAAAGRAQSASQFAQTQDAGKQQIIQSDSGPLLVNTRTGSGRAISGPDGLPLAGVSKPLNDSQSKALLFGTRMQEADKVLASLANEGTRTSVPGSSAPIVGGVINALSTDNKQMLNQAKTDFMTAILRRESGAAISSGEYDTANKQYFPQVGDSKGVIEQKAKNRALAINGVLVEVPEKQRKSITPAGPSNLDALLEKYK